MPSSSVVRAAALIMLGFLLGVIVSGFDRLDSSDTQGAIAATSYTGYRLGGQSFDYEPLAATERWDIVGSNGGRHIAIGRNGTVRVSIVDDDAALYVMTYGQNAKVWEGRLVDVGNDGSVEVADLTGSRCEQF